MSHALSDMVTGAFGYSGRRIAERLLQQGRSVRTLSNSARPADPSLAGIECHPYDFEDPSKLRRSLAGTAVLYNTYWVRFNSKSFTYAQAIRNSKILFREAHAAGVQRIVHVSITNPSSSSELEYFRGKAEVERALHDAGVPHTILRPAVLFGGEDILINNIAWMIRRFPVFGMPGSGEYKLQPIHVDDLAQLAVEAGSDEGSRTCDAIGPETFTYIGLVQLLTDCMGLRRRIASLPPGLCLTFAQGLGWWLRDVVITRDEITGLMAGMLAVDSAPTGRTRLSEWARANAAQLGRRYASEMARRR